VPPNHPDVSNLNQRSWLALNSRSTEHEWRRRRRQQQRRRGRIRWRT
jgi:hypothetical protein